MNTSYISSQKHNNTYLNGFIVFAYELCNFCVCNTRIGIRKEVEDRIEGSYIYCWSLTAVNTRFRSIRNERFGHFSHTLSNIIYIYNLHLVYYYYLLLVVFFVLYFSFCVQQQRPKMLSKV